MEVERYYYAVASFMRKDDKISVTSVTCSVKGEEKDIKFYPLMNIITDVEEKFKNDMVSGTVIVQSVIEISKQDYDAFKERIAKMKEKNGKVTKVMDKFLTDAKLRLAQVELLQKLHDAAERHKRVVILKGRRFV